MAAYFLTSPYDWGYKFRENDKLHSRTTYYPRGYTLGGSRLLKLHTFIMLIVSLIILVDLAAC